MAKKIDISKRSNKYLSVGAYDYDGLAHWWAYNYGHKSTASDRMSTSGNLVYSYQTVVAKMFPPKEAGSPPMVLIAGGSWSPTTSKHINCISSSVSHMNRMRVSECNPGGKSDHKDNLVDLFRSALDASKSYPRARVEHSKEGHLRRFHDAIRTASSYAEYFKLKNTKEYKAIMQLPDPSGAESKEELQQILDKIEKSKKAAKAKKLRDMRKQDIENAEKADRDLKEWLSGANNMPNQRYLDGVYIRIKGAVIETTAHASISLKSCISAFRKYEKGTLKIGDDISGFDFRGIDDGIAKVGCHDVPMKRIELLLKGLQNESK